MKVLLGLFSLSFCASAFAQNDQLLAVRKFESASYLFLVQCDYLADRLGSLQAYGSTTDIEHQRVQVDECISSNSLAMDDARPRLVGYAPFDSMASELAECVSSLAILYKSGLGPRNDERTRSIYLSCHAMSGSLGRALSAAEKSER